MSNLHVMPSPVTAKNDPQAILARMRGESFFEKALATADEGDLQEATHIYNQALEADPNSSGSLVNLGVIATQNRDFQAAERYFRRAIAIDPEYAKAHYNLGCVVGEQGRTMEELVFYHQALAANPHYDDALFNIAVAYAGLGENHQALRYYNIYIRHRINDSDRYLAIAKEQVERLIEILRAA